MCCRFSVAAQIFSAHQFIEGLGAEFAAKDQVPLLIESIMEVLLSSDRVLVSTSRHFSIIQ